MGDPEHPPSPKASTGRMAGARIDVGVREYRERRGSGMRRQSESRSDVVFGAAFDAKTKASDVMVLRIQPGDIANLANKYRLDFTEVRDTLGLLAESAAHSERGLDKDAFAEILRKIFNLSSRAMPSNIVDQAWSRMDRQKGKSGSEKTAGAAEAEGFLEWYSENMFNREIRETDLSSATARSGVLAQKHGVSLVEIDKIRAIFDSFDLNGSGKIDREEFQVMLMSVFRAKTVDDEPSERANRFWMEIKQDASLTISFPEFCGWYITNFSTQDEGDDFATMASKLYEGYARRGSCDARRGSGLFSGGAMVAARV